MIKRRKINGNGTLDCDCTQMEELYRSQINGITSGVRNTMNKCVQTDIPSTLKPPTFGIHIHIPPVSGRNFQMYLPRLHPIVHVHFDELARKLEIRKGQNEEETYRLFKSFVAMTSPTYGDVKFYTTHRSEDGSFKESEVLATTTTTTTTTVTSQNIPNGLLPCISKTKTYSRGTARKTCSSQVGKSCVRIRHQSPKMNINEINKSQRKRSLRELEKEFQLKKAVVVLTDICKSKYYKNLFKTSTNVSTEEGVEDSQNDLGRTENEECSIELCEEPLIKTEIESPEPESPHHENDRTNSTSSSKLMPPSNDFGSVKSEENVNHDMTKSLISLVEGCNFSEILHRFKVKKCEEHLAESVKTLNGPTVENFVSNSEHNYTCERSEQNSSDHENIFVNKETWAGDNVPGGIESVVTATDHFDWKISEVESEVSNTFVDVNLPSASLNASTNTQSDVEHDVLVDEKLDDTDVDDENDDENEVPKMFSNQKIIRATSNSEIEILSSGTSPFLIPVNRFQFLKSDENNSDCNSNINFQLKLIKKEMAKRNRNNSNRSNSKKGKGVKKKALKSSSEGKKSKNLEQQKTDISSRTDDYIPLNATGSTRFAVAPLNKVSPYKSHDARNFKNEMLFGNRVNRFQSADHLRIYKMKKNAGKRTSG